MYKQIIRHVISAPVKTKVIIWGESIKLLYCRSIYDIISHSNLLYTIAMHDLCFSNYSVIWKCVDFHGNGLCINNIRI